MPGRAKMAPLPFVDLAKGKGTALEEREKRCQVGVVIRRKGIAPVNAITYVLWSDPS